MSSKRRWLVVIVYFVITAVASGILERIGVHNSTVSNIGFANPALRLGEFLLGVAAGVEAKEGGGVPARIGAGLLALGLLMTAVLPRSQNLPDAYMTIGFFGLIVLAARRDMIHPTGLLASRWFVYAGEVSFCFYLVHQLVIINLQNEVGHGGYGVAALALAVSVALAVALHHAVERPMQSLIRGRASARQSIATAPVTELPT